MCILRNRDEKREKEYDIAFNTLRKKNFFFFFLRVKKKEKIENYRKYIKKKKKLEKERECIA